MKKNMWSTCFFVFFFKLYMYINIFCCIIFTSTLARDESINMDMREVFMLFFWLHIWRMSSEGNASICWSHRVRTSSIPFDKRCSAPSGRLKCEWLHLTGVITHAPCKSLKVKKIQGARKETERKICTWHGRWSSTLSWRPKQGDRQQEEGETIKLSS